MAKDPGPFSGGILRRAPNGGSRDGPFSSVPVRSYARSLLVPVVLALLSACGGRVPPPENGPGGPVASAAVERFLQLAGSKSYVQMGWVFGTAAGPVMRQWPLPEVEQRMYALATVLQHDSFVVGRESPVPGRAGAAVRFESQLLRQGRTFQVPVVAVRGPQGRWYVEQVDVQAITNVR